jgi:hypothetical protein
MISPTKRTSDNDRKVDGMALLSGPAAIIEAFYPNSAGAGAIGPALFGETNRFGTSTLC